MFRYKQTPQGERRRSKVLRHRRRRCLLSSRTESPADLFKKMKALSNSLEGLPLPVTDNRNSILTVNVDDDSFVAELKNENGKLLYQFEAYFIENDENGDDRYDIYFNGENEEDKEADEVYYAFSSWVNDVRQMSNVQGEIAEWELSNQGAVDSWTLFENELSRYNSEEEVPDGFIQNFLVQSAVPQVIDYLEEKNTGNGLITYLREDVLGSDTKNVVLSLHYQFACDNVDRHTNILIYKSFVSSIFELGFSVEEAVHELEKYAAGRVSGVAMLAVSDWFEDVIPDQYNVYPATTFNSTTGKISLEFTIYRASVRWLKSLSTEVSTTSENPLTTEECLRAPIGNKSTLGDVLRPVFDSGWSLEEATFRCDDNRYVIGRLYFQYQNHPNATNSSKRSYQSSGWKTVNYS